MRQLNENNSATYFIQNKTTSWMVVLILLLGGISAYMSLGRLEDPAFTLKQAMIITSYPGASPQQVEEEVTFPLENAIQQLPYVDFITSISKAGLSQITVEMRNIYDGEDLPQIWDEMRRKIRDAEKKLPPGVQPARIMDDFGDVYGILFAIHGEGYSIKEIEDYSDYLKRELILVDGVGKIDVVGKQTEQVYIEISQEKLTNYGLSIGQLFQLLQTQNSVSSAGKVKVGSEYIRIQPTGEFNSVQELENLIISAPGNPKLIFLKDVAKVVRGPVEVPSHIVTYNQALSLHLGVSFSEGVNVVKVGERIQAKMDSLKSSQPLGMRVDTIYNQPVEVNRSSNDFIFNLIAAVVIVIAVLFVFMGWQSGMIIGLVLLLTILGTFIIMKLFDIELQRISLGALIVALGMLVDNAIVVTEGILVGLKRGQSKIDTAWSVVRQTQWPLLGATVIAITAFAPIGLSPDATGEFAGSLFQVLLISLFLSWITAITITPFFCDLWFKEDEFDDDSEDPYKGVVFDVYRKLLTWGLENRGRTMATMVGLLFLAIVGFGFVKQAFFPPSTTPMFLIDVWTQEGSDIRHTKSQVEKLETFISQDKRIEFTATTIGRGETRFMLTYAPQKNYESYGQLIIRANSLEDILSIIPDIQTFVATELPQIETKIRRLEIGPATPAKIEARFTGPEPDILRRLASETKAILHAESGATNIRHDWRERTKVIRPKFNEAHARRAGVSKQDLDDLLQMNYVGKAVGLYREGTDLMQIVARSPQEERFSIDKISQLQIWSPVYSRYIPIEQIVDDFEVQWEDPLIMRRDRKRTITIMADPLISGEETAAAVFGRVRPLVEAIEMPAGYSLEWGGEFEQAGKAQASLFGALPMGFLIMFIITVLLFNSAKNALVIWACVPLALIGVSFGLLLLNAEFTFMALLGFLSLSGMIIKNGIVLVDQINLDLALGKSPYQAVFDASVSRVRPVAMAAITTILGMLPLLPDAFFSSMAVVICFGLGFATVLTLIVVPVLYAMTQKIDNPDLPNAAK